MVSYDTVVKETIHFNILERGNNLLNRLGVMYGWVCMATTRDKYYTKMLETLVDYNGRNNAPFSNEKL